MKYEVLLTDTAKSDLREIAVRIAEESQNKELAKRFVGEISAQCSTLTDFPLRGSVPKDRTLASLGYRFLVYKEYLIFYSVDEPVSKVYVLAVFNAKKDYTRVLKKMF